jgi:endonuclease YncB( thermonuclease family)
MSTTEPHIVMLYRIAFSLLICLMPIRVFAGVTHQGDVKGFVVNVSHDCQLIVSIDHQAEIVRLAGIDFSNEDFREKADAREFVRSRVMNKTVRIELMGKDPRGNIFGRIYVKQFCLNEALIQEGLAAPAPVKDRASSH